MRSSLDQIRDWLERAECAKYIASRLAGGCGVSQRHLSRYFKECSGRSPQVWLDEIRLWKSLLAVWRSHYVTGIIPDLNYCSRSTFYSQFRKYFGIAPLLFIQNWETVDAFFAPYEKESVVDRNCPNLALWRLQIGVIREIKEGEKPRCPSVAQNDLQSD